MYLSYKSRNAVCLLPHTLIDTVSGRMPASEVGEGIVFVQRGYFLGYNVGCVGGTEQCAISVFLLLISFQQRSIAHLIGQGRSTSLQWPHGDARGQITHAQ